MNILKKAVSAAAAVLFFGLLRTAPARAEEAEPKSGVAVIYVNDVHCSIDPAAVGEHATFGYADLAAYEAKLKDEGYTTVLVDAGDFSQGQAVGTLSKGGYLIDIMNELGFDYATIGNHEFDYGIPRLLELTDKADFKVLCGNFRDIANDKQLYDGWDIFEADGLKIGFVGIATPESRTAANPMFFKDENGDFLYDLCVDKSGAALYESVQRSVDEARAAGADYIVALAHLGILEKSAPWRSTDVIANTTGIDAVIDGHSHSVINSEVVSDLGGNDVILTSTGTQLLNIGTMFFEDGGVSAGLVSADDYKVTEDTESNEYKAYAKAAEAIGKIESEYSGLVKKVVASSDDDLIMVDPEDGVSLIVRFKETNLGDFVADAYRIMLNADVGLINGGGIRYGLFKGDVTYENILAVHPFGNGMCVCEATGQEILDALEVGASANPKPLGGFLQVSGLTFEIHNYISSGVVLADGGGFDRVEGERRVRNVMVNGEPLDPDRIYTVAANNFMIKSGGSNMSMFMDNKLIIDETALDNQVLIDYVNEKLGGVITGYDDPEGSGRIKIFSEKPEAEEKPAEPAPEATSEASSETAEESVPESASEAEKSPASGEGQGAAPSTGIAPAVLPVLLAASFLAALPRRRS